MKSRRAWVAGLLGALQGGLGFLYVGRPFWVIAWLLIPLALVASLAWSRAIFHLWGMPLLLAFGLGFWIAGIVLPALIARRTKAMELRQWQRWYIYLGIFILSGALGMAYTKCRGPLFGFENFRIPSISMEATLLRGDFILADEWAYASGHLPQRGDLVIYRAGEKPSDIFVKRVIGLPGESLDMKQGIVFVNGAPLNEIYVIGQHNLRTAQQERHFDVPQGAYFVLGDNRDDSNDSRYKGPVESADILGRAELIWLSWDANAGLRRDRIGLRLR